MASETATATKPAGRGCAPALLHEAYLRQLGERVRDARARRGMSRKQLAQDSGVSERYLAQLEGGQGNVSIALLRQITTAMNMPLCDLVREGPEPPVELALIDEFLSHLNGEQLAEVHRWLFETFGEVEDRRGRIALIGLRGAGKSTVGRLLAETLHVPFVELAREIEADAGMDLDEIFALSGQAAYRRYERRSLERVIAEHRKAVIATGGGVVSEPKTFEMLLNSCYTIWLKATPEEHMARVIAQGDRRPMAGNSEAMDDLKRILRNREALYAKADRTVTTTGLAPEEVAARLRGLLQGHRARP